MAKLKQYIAVDLGASSGRVMLGTVADETITLEQMHRFDGCPTLYGITTSFLSIESLHCCAA